MSLTELKQSVDGLSGEERLALADYLRRRAKQDDPQWPAEVGRRLDRCLKGGGHLAEELQRLHHRLAAENS